MRTALYLHALTCLPVLTHPYLLTHYVLIEYIRCSGWSLACCCACPHSLMLPTTATCLLSRSFIHLAYLFLVHQCYSVAYVHHSITHSLTKLFVLHSCPSHLAYPRGASVICTSLSHPPGLLVSLLPSCSTFLITN